MAYIDVTSAAQLYSVLQVVKAGDVVRLAGGDYGDVVINSKMFAGEVTITSQDPGHPASFGSLAVNNSANITFDHVNVDYVPNASTVSFSSAVTVDGSKGISFLNGHIEGGPAVNGVAPTATYGDATGNVLGEPAGRAITIQNSSDVTVSGSDISQFDRGIAIGGDGVTISNNEIHDLRRTAIVGGGDNLVIDGNYLHTARPWHVGQAGGDHADFIALWTDPKQTKPTDNVVISNNILDRGDGAQILGLWLSGDKAGFTNVSIDHNVLIGTDNQGIMLTNVVGGYVTDNVLLQTVYYAGPGILLRDGVQGIEMSGNIAWAVVDKNAAGNNVHDNTVAQTNTVGKAGYYDASLLAKVSTLQDTGAIHDLVSSSLTTTANPVAAATSAVVAPAVNTAELTTNQTLTGNSQSDYLEGGSGNDTIDAGGGGADTLIGGAGDDTYIVPGSLAKIVEQAGGGIDTVIARGDHVLTANVENLTISSAANNNWSGTGNELNNVLTGNGGNNQLNGLAGNDTLDGGAGNDVLTGGSGADTFIMAKGYGADRVTDFSQIDGDRIQIAAGTTYDVKQVGSDTIIDLGGGDQMVLTGVNLASLMPDWIQSEAPLVPVVSYDDLDGGVPSQSQPMPPPVTFTWGGFTINLSGLEFSTGWLWP